MNHIPPGQDFPKIVADFIQGYQISNKDDKNNVMLIITIARTMMNPLQMKIISKTMEISKKEVESTLLEIIEVG